MKPLFLFVLLYICVTIKAQLPVSANTFNGDTVVSTNYEVLDADTTGGKVKVTDNVVGVRIISRKEDSYWLYFYFIPNDIPASSVSISDKQYAYLITAQNKCYRVPYSGRAFRYSTSAKAGFFIDITNYAMQLKNEVITGIRFETSVLYHAVELKDESQAAIAHIVDALLSYQ